VTPIANNDVDDRNITQLAQAAAAFEDEVAQARDIPAAAFQDPEFMRRRYERVVTDLDDAKLLITQLLQKLEPAEDDAPPPAVRHAMSGHSHRIHPIDVVINGQEFTVGVPGLGIDEHEIAQRWSKLRKRYDNRRRGHP
jgi:hypothetical protein